MENNNKPRLYYIDNLRIFLIGLVVLHHLAITYGAPGGWYYQESQAGIPEIVPMAMFLATNQAFFMGMFFFISAYFLVPSLERKGTKQFVNDRLLRLGLPTLFFFFLLNPLTIFTRNRHLYGNEVGFVDYWLQHPEFGSGPMWFVLALIIFTATFLAWRALKTASEKRQPIPLPSPIVIIVAAILIGLGQFIIRIWLPVGWSMPITNFQLPHFLQYIFLFALGIVAYQQKWLEQLSPKSGMRWFIAMQALIFIGFPAIFIGGGAAEGDLSPFMGGMTWQSLAYALWEQLVGFGLIVALFGIFKMKWNDQGTFGKALSASAYGTYVFHAPILVGLAVVFLHLPLPQFWKFIAIAPVALAISFGFAYLLKKLPFIGERIL